MTSKIRNYLTEESRRGKIPGYKEAPGTCMDCASVFFKGEKGTKKMVMVCNNPKNIESFDFKEDPFYHQGILGSATEELIVSRHGWCPRYRFAELGSLRMGYNQYEKDNKNEAS